VRRWTLPLILALLLLVPAPVGARQTPPTQAGATEASPAPITMEALERAWTAAQGATDDETADDLRATYDEATALIEQARALEAEARQFAAQVAEAPETLQSIRQELSQPAAELGANLPPEPTVDQVQQALAQAQADLAAGRQQVTEVEAEQARRESRRAAIPGEIAQARQSLSDLTGQPVVAGADEAPAVTELRRSRRAAERRLLEARVRRLEQELASYDARRELLPVRRDRAARRVSDLESLISRLETTLNETRRREADRSARAAQQALRESTGSSEAVRRLAAENAELASMLTGESGIAARIADARAARDAARSQLDAIARNYVRVRELIADIGLTNTVGITLRAFRGDLPNTSRLERSIRARQDNLENTIYTLYDLEQRRRDLADLEDEVAAAVEDYRASNPSANEQEIEAVAGAARRLLQDRVELLNSVLRDYRAYRELLLDLDAAQRRLRDATAIFDDYIAERVLWTANAEPLGLRDFAAAGRRLQWSFDPAPMLAMGRGVLVDWARNPHRPALAIGMFALLLFLRRRSLRAVGAESALERGPLRGAIQGAALAIFAAAIWPAAVLLVAWLLESAAAMPDTPVVRMESLARAFRETAILLFLLRFIAIICRPDGYAVQRLNWRPSAVAAIRTRVRWYMPLAVLVAFVGVTAPLDLGDTGVDAPDPIPLRRLAGVAFMLLTSLALWRIFRPRGPVMQEIRLASPTSWRNRFRFVWLAVLVGGPLVIASLSLFGFVYTAVELGRRLIVTLLALAGVVIIQSALTQWLVSARRKLEIEQARRRREAAEHESEDTGPGGEGVSRPPEETDLAALDTQTRRLFRSGVTITTALLLWLIWAPAAPALRMLERVEIYPNFGQVTSTAESIDDNAESILNLTGVLGARPTIGAPDGAPAPPANGAAPPNQSGAQPPAGDAPAPSTTTTSPAGPAGSLLSPGVAGAQSADADGVGASRVTLGQVLLALILAMVALAASRNVPGLIEITLLQRLELDSGLRNAVTALVRYTIAIVGLLVAFSVAGLSWSKVQWLAAALTFGLAFGLQEIFANFVSGLIILFERPIRIGDTVTVGDVSGEVTQIRFRATTVTDWDRKELIVPNKEFITTRLINWTLTDPVLRIIIPVGVAYGSDVKKTTDALLRVAKRYQNVLDEPPPRALFLGFGDSSLSFELRVFIPSMDYLIEVKDAMHRGIDAEFRKQGVEIAFPQRDLHIRSVSEKAAGALTARSSAPSDDPPGGS